MKLFFVGIAGLIVVLLLAMLHTGPARERVLEMAGHYLDAQQNIQLQAETIDYNLLTLTVRLTGVSLRAKAPNNPPPFLRADSVAVNLGITRLPFGVLTIKDATVNGLQLQVIQGEGGESNLPSAPVAEAEGGENGIGLAVAVERLRVPGAALRIEDRVRKLELELPRWNLEVDGDPSTLEHRVRFETHGAGSLALAGSSTPLNRVLIAMEAGRGGARVGEAVLQTAGSRIEATGNLANWESLDFTGALRLDLEEAGSLYALDPLPVGAVEAKWRATGTAESPDIEAEINGSGLGWRRIRDLKLAAAVQWEGESGQLTVRTLEAQSPAGTITAKGLLATGEQGGESRLTASVRRLDLIAIGQTLEWPVGLASRLDSTIEANWQGLDWKTASGSIAGTLSPSLAAAEENRLPVSGRFSASGTALSAGIRLNEVSVLGTLWNGSLNVEEFDRLGGELNATIDTATLHSGLAAFLGGERNWPAVEGEAGLQVSLGGSVEEPTAAVQLSAGDLRAGQLDGLAADISGLYRTDSFSLESLTLAWRGQQLSANGVAGLSEDNSALAFEATLDNGRIETVLAGLGLDVPVSGAFTAAARIDGTLDAPGGTLTLSANELSAYGEELGQLAATSSYAAGVAKLDSLRLNTPTGGDVEATGEYNLEAKTYAVDLSADALEFDTLNVGGTPLRGKLSFSAAGAGSLDQPNLQADLSADGIAAGDRELGGLKLQASVAGGAARAQWQAPGLSAHGTLTTALNAPYETDFTVETQGTDLAVLALDGPDGKPISGRLTASIDGRAPLDDFLTGRITAAIEDVRVEVAGHEVHNSAPLLARLEGGALHLDSVAIATGESSASLSGVLPIESARPGAEVRIDGDIDVAGLLTFATLPEDLAATGRIRIAGTIEGSLREPLPNLELQLDDGTLTHSALREPLTGVGLRAAYRDGTIRLDSLQATLGTATLEATGETPLPGSEQRTPARLDARLSNLQLRSFTATPEEVNGELSVRINGETSHLSDLRQLQAEAVFDKLQLSVSGVTLQAAEPARIVLREGVATIESLSLDGPETNLQATGKAGLLEGGELDIAVTGTLDASLMSQFYEAIQASGPLRLEVAVRGPLSAPDVTGFLEMQKGELIYPEYGITAENLDIRLDLTKEMVTVSRLKGVLNGGPMSGSGRIPLSDDRANELVLGLAVRNGFFNYPDGLKTQVWATLMVQPKGNEYELGGKIKILDGAFREPLEIEGQLFEFMGSSGFEMPTGRSPFLDKINYNIAVETQNPVVIENNLMELSIESNLRVTGDYYQPGMTGQLTIQEGGELYLNERRYFVEQGVVTFVNERSIQPDLEILAKTRAANHDINLRLSGGAEDYSATFTSDPPLPEPDIISLLLTGRTLEQSRGAELNIATEQALSYVSGRAASRVSRSAEQALGVSSVRIEPNLVARDSNPGARLTIGQDITNKLRFVYSMNLVDPADQMQIVEYDVTKGFLARGTRQQDNTARFDIEHGFVWGGAPVEVEEVSLQKDLRIGEIHITGTPELPEATVRENLGLQTGQKYSFFKTQNRFDKLRAFYRNEGYLEARVRARREILSETVDLDLEVEAGPRVEFAFQGMDPPGSLRKRVRRAWEDGFADTQRDKEALEAVRSGLFDNNYLQAAVRSEVSQPATGQKRVTFIVEPGTRYGDVQYAFPGAESVAASELRALVVDPKRRAMLRGKPGEIAALLEEYYRQQGRLQAKVAEPKFEYDEGRRSARIVFAVDEGPAFRVGEIAIEGNQAFPRERLLETAFIQKGAEYSKEWMDTWVSRLEELYWTNGYNEVEIEYALQQREDATVDLLFRLREGLQGRVESVTVEGAHDTAEKMARRQVELADGDVLNYRKTIESRRNLYQLGAYSMVDLEPQRLTPDEATGRAPIRMRVKLRERKPFSVRYGVSYDTERGPGFISDVSLHNKLGAARVIGGRLRYDSEFREARGYLTQPVMFGRHLNTTAAGYRSREIFATFTTDRVGFSIQQQTRLWKGNIFTYGYRFERTETFDKDPDSIFQVPPFNVAPLQFTWNRETRDEYLNATKGSFVSSGVEWAPSRLGSDVQFVKYVGQFFKYVPLRKPVEVPFGGPPRSRWVYAVAVRAGLGKGLGGQGLIQSERFFAGGSTTLRGFGRDSVGPQDFFGPTGGDATFITNNEIRFPIHRWIEGVGFLDMGNVYRSVSDFNPADLRYSSGFGIRVRTPLVLLRVDYGFILDRQPGEPVGGFYFSIGQSF